VPSTRIHPLSHLSFVPWTIRLGIAGLVLVAVATKAPASSLPENETRKQIYNRSHALQHRHLRLMELSNALVAATERPREVVETLILLLSPFAPHIAEELWG
jgi:hypothetical protein